MNIFGTKKREVKKKVKMVFKHDEKYTYEAVGIDHEKGNEITKSFLRCTLDLARQSIKGEGEFSKSQAIEKTYKEAIKIMGKKELTHQDMFAIGFIIGKAENEADDFLKDAKEHYDADREGREPHTGERGTRSDRVRDMIKKKMQEIGKELGAEVVMVEGDNPFRGKPKKTGIATISSDEEVNDLPKDDKDLFLEHLKNKNEKKREIN